MARMSNEWRSHLRHLKVVFDDAFDQLGTPPDRDHPQYPAALDAYKQWRSAIDAAALTLFDELDGLHAENLRLRHELTAMKPSVMNAPMPVKQADVAQAFHEMDDMKHLLDIIDLPA